MFGGLILANVLFSVIMVMGIGMIFEVSISDRIILGWIIFCAFMLIDISLEVSG